MNNIYEGHL